MNEYFCSIGASLANNLSAIPTSKKFADYLPNSTFNSFVFHEISIDELIQVMEKIKNKTGVGIDKINSKFVYEFRSIIAPVLCSILNKSVLTGIFPEELKIAKTIPIPKTKTNLDLPSKFRPISLISIFSKIFEKLIVSRFTKYFTKFNILYDFQFGFRSHHSTKLALINSIDDVRSQLGNDSLVVGIFLDLSKAFDALDHNILLSKLYNYGIRGFMFSWVKSYLSGRSQITSINNCSSASSPIRFGVPQGSVLGPLLFHIYINDIGNIPDMPCKPKLFADDTNLFVSARNYPALQSKCQDTLNKVVEWIFLNRLTLNTKKPVIWFFPLNNRLIFHWDFN